MLGALLLQSSSKSLISSTRTLKSHTPTQNCATQAHQSQCSVAWTLRFSSTDRPKNSSYSKRRGMAGKCAVTESSQAEHRAFQSSGLSNGFSDSTLQTFAIAVVGDLHLEPGQMSIFDSAARQLSAAVAGEGGAARLVQLGDLGGYDHHPGSRHCFEVAAEYLERIPASQALVAGNHDLEGDEFETDEQNLAAWTQAFGQRHYWAAELGSVLCLGLSTVRFRGNKDSVHEVYVDDEQLAWFEQQLESSAGRPVFVFTHAPPLGCGLKVVEAVHVKNRCAWLNHSSNPEVFLGLVHRFPNIRLWFSGHFHLSQNYADSVATVGGCAFLQTGVIGECDRDGYHQSRIVRGDRDGFRVYTFNHASGEERLDLQQAWAATAPPRVAWLTGQQKQWWPAGLVFHQHGVRPPLAEKESELSSPASASGRAAEEKWWGAGPDCVLRLMGDLLVEYKASYRAAVGVVMTGIDHSDEVVLVDANGSRVLSQASSLAPPTEDGSSAVAVQVVTRQGSVQRQVVRNAEGTFYQIFQRNKWRLRGDAKKQQLMSVAT